MAAEDLRATALRLLDENVAARDKLNKCVFSTIMHMRGLVNARKHISNAVASAVDNADEKFAYRAARNLASFSIMQQQPTADFISTVVAATDAADTLTANIQQLQRVHIMLTAADDELRTNISKAVLSGWDQLINYGYVPMSSPST
jgi:hypothetical protein